MMVETEKCSLPASVEEAPKQHLDRSVEGSNLHITWYVTEQPDK